MHRRRRHGRGVLRARVRPHVARPGPRQRLRAGRRGWPRRALGLPAAQRVDPLAADHARGRVLCWRRVLRGGVRVDARDAPLVLDVWLLDAVRHAAQRARVAPRVRRVAAAAGLFGARDVGRPLADGLGQHALARRLDVVRCAAVAAAVGRRGLR
eukprot:7387246-Prymnesium_polylepis.1